jgi:hypothetical protein
MRHVEGGWPKDVDFSEQADVTRFRKKAEKDDEYKVRREGGQHAMGVTCLWSSRLAPVHDRTDMALDFEARPDSALTVQNVPHVSVGFER